MRSGRLIIFGVSIFFCIGVLALSATGLLSPIGSVLNIPVSGAQRAVAGLTRRVSNFISDLSNFQTLQQRNSDLEKAFVALQAELVELREIKADYDQIAKQLGYINRAASAQRQYKRADVIGRDTTGLLRTVTINLGTRDGLAVGMPVVTELGLVGRISAVTAISAQVRLITDPGSFVNARLQDTRAEGQVVPGSIQGTASGDLRMTFIPLPVKDSDRIADGEVVITSGIGGNFPRGIIIGQVISSRLDDSRLFQEAEVRSLVNFSRLEYVLVITNFEPIDLSNLGTPAPGQ